MREISRDPFARETLCRETTAKHGRKPCDWCGSREGRFAYFTETDSGRRHYHKGEFCSKPCHDSYHGAL